MEVEYFDNLIDKKFNKLTFISYSGMDKLLNGRRVAKGVFKCECGKVKSLSITLVVNGYIKSCGCRPVLRLKKICKECKNDFYVTSNTKKQIYCSRKCFSKVKIDPAVRFMKYVKKSSGCWTWVGPKNHSGYGTFSVKEKDKRKTYLSSRFMYKYMVGELGVKMCVCHKCDNPICVNPDHLFLGTHLDNTKDMIRKNRQNYPKKGTGGKTKLDWNRVKEIRELYLKKNSHKKR